MNKKCNVKIIYVFLLVCMCVVCANAQEYRITKMSHPKKIKIGGEWKSEGSSFDGNAKIEWENGRQWFKATRNGKMYKVTCNSFKSIASGTMNAFEAKYLGHKGGNNVHYSKKEYFLMGKGDTLMIDTRGRTDSDTQITARWNNGSQVVESSIQKTPNKKHYIISTDIYKNVQSIPEHIKLSIEEQKNGTVDNVYSDLDIYYYPEQ